MAKIKNVSNNVYIGADKGTGRSIRVNPGEVANVTDEMEEYLFESWPEKWELMDDVEESAEASKSEESARKVPKKKQ